MISFRSICLNLTVGTRFCSSSLRRSQMQNKMYVLYGDEASPPVRFVMITASLLKIKLNFHKIDLFLGENRTPFYTKMNPLQKVPVLDTGKAIICDSHAIALYLCRLSESGDLYPEDTLLRARVEQMLFFNSSSLFPVDSSLMTEHFFGKPLDITKIEQWEKLLKILDTQLSSSLWLAGDKMTLCDLACGNTISSLELLLPKTKHYPKVSEWMKRLEQVPCYSEISSRGLKRLAGFIQHFTTD